MFPMCACWLRAGPTICPTMLRIMLALQETANIRMPTRHWWFQLLFEEVGAELHAHALLLGLCAYTETCWRRLGLHGLLLPLVLSSAFSSALAEPSQRSKCMFVCLGVCVYSRMERQISR